MSERFVCGITLYRPDYSVINRIKDYSKCFVSVYIFDNTEIEYKDFTLIDLINSISNIVYFSDGINHGLPYAYNYIIDNISSDINYICTLDQDSVFLANDISSIENKISSLSDNMMYGIIAPYVLYDSKDYKKKDEILSVRYVITSGSFVSLDVLRQNGIKYDESYFIDKFEIDLGEQIKRKGYLIGQYQGAVLQQRLGELDSKGRRNHSPLRHYYLFRNRFYFNNKFYSFPKKQLLTFLQVIKHISIILFHEEDKRNKLKMLPQAFADYKNNNLGKKEFI